MNSKLDKKENNIEKSFLSIFITTFTKIFIAELGDKFLIDCCKQHISSNYGYKSKEMKNFNIAVSGK